MLILTFAVLHLGVLVTLQSSRILRDNLCASQIVLQFVAQCAASGFRTSQIEDGVAHHSVAVATLQGDFFHRAGQHSRCHATCRHGKPWWQYDEGELLLFWHVTCRAYQHIEFMNEVGRCFQSAYNLCIHIFFLHLGLGLCDEDVDVRFRLKPVCGTTHLRGI